MAKKVDITTLVAQPLNLGGNYGKKRMMVLNEISQGVIERQRGEYE